MEIVVGKLAGFCFGVNNAVTKTSELIKKEKNLYCLGELVHNRQVVESLEKQGITTVENIDEVPKEAKIIIRAHGIPPIIYEKAKQNKNEIYDYTCPKVLKTHDDVIEHKNEYYIFICGVKNHPEVTATQGFSGENSYVIETEEDLNKAILEFKQSKMNKIYIISQTTFSLKKFNNFVEKISEELKEYSIKVNNSICASTRTRQEEAEEISKKVDYMIIIGGKNSSNTKKLYEIARENTKSIHIQTKEQLNLEEIKKYMKIGITAGASTPKENVQEIVDILEGIK
jgi:4-hydroxy-3-methylbut-2-enyl diphosphate reductase